MKVLTLDQVTEALDGMRAVFEDGSDDSWWYIDRLDELKEALQTAAQEM